MARITSVTQRQLTTTAPDQSKELVVARLGSLSVASYSTAISSNSLVGVDQPLTVTVTTSNVSNGTQLRFRIVGDSRDSFDPNTGTVIVSGNEAVISTTTIANPASGSVTITIAKTAGTVVAESGVISVSISAELPVNTSPPSISGTVSLGETLTCLPGTWTGIPAPSYTFQWQRGSTNISGATDSTYTVTNSDIDNTLRCVVTGTNIAGSASATSASTTLIAGPTYAVTPAANSVNEGSSLTFNVVTTNVNDTTTLYWTVTNAGDFATSAGSFTINSNAGSFFVTPAADLTTEGAETFTANVRTGSTSGDIVATSSTVTINDTSITPIAPSTYAVTPAANSVNEGSSLTFNVVTTNVNDTTTLYWTVTNAGDFAESSGAFIITSNAGSFSVTPTADLTTEGAETFTANVRTGSTGGTIVATSSTVTINDTSITSAFDPDYTITVTNSGNNYLLTGSDRNGSFSNASQPALAFNNGDFVRFNVNAGTAYAHPFYIKTTQSGGTGNLVSGVTGQGTTQLDWTTATAGAGTFGYQCSIHFNMWNTIAIS